MSNAGDAGAAVPGDLVFASESDYDSDATTVCATPSPCRKRKCAPRTRAEVVAALVAATGDLRQAANAAKRARVCWDNASCDATCLFGDSECGVCYSAVDVMTMTNCTCVAVFLCRRCHANVFPRCPFCRGDLGPYQVSDILPPDEPSEAYRFEAASKFISQKTKDFDTATRKAIEEVAYTCQISTTVRNVLADIGGHDAHPLALSDILGFIDPIIFDETDITIYAMRQVTDAGQILGYDKSRVLRHLQEAATQRLEELVTEAVCHARPLYVDMCKHYQASASGVLTRTECGAAFKGVLASLFG